MPAPRSLHRQLGERLHECIVLGNLGTLYWDQGCIEQAHRSYEQALAIARDVGSRSTE